MTIRMVSGQIFQNFPRFPQKPTQDVFPTQQGNLRKLKIEVYGMLKMYANKLIIRFVHLTSFDVLTSDFVDWPLQRKALTRVAPWLLDWSARFCARSRVWAESRRFASRPDSMDLIRFHACRWNTKLWCMARLRLSHDAKRIWREWFWDFLNSTRDTFVDTWLLNGPHDTWVCHISCVFSPTYWTYQTITLDWQLLAFPEGLECHWHPQVSKTNTTSKAFNHYFQQDQARHQLYVGL